jgi:hypothetical protein
MFFRIKNGRFSKQNTPKEEEIECTVTQEQDDVPETLESINRLQLKATIDGNKIYEHQNDFIIEHTFETEDYAVAYYTENFAGVYIN